MGERDIKEKSPQPISPPYPALSPEREREVKEKSSPCVGPKNGVDFGSIFP
jgi:hypothetical protein